LASGATAAANEILTIAATGSSYANSATEPGAWALIGNQTSTIRQIASVCNFHLTIARFQLF